MGIPKLKKLMLPQLHKADLVLTPKTEKVQNMSRQTPPVTDYIFRGKIYKCPTECNLSRSQTTEAYEKKLRTAIQKAINFVERKTGLAVSKRAALSCHCNRKKPRASVRGTFVDYNLAALGVSIKTLVHEFSHVVTPLLNKLGFEFNYITEGFAVWVTNKYFDRSHSYFSAKIDLDLTKFPRPRKTISEGRINEFAYDLGCKVMDTIEEKFGENVVIEIIREMESLKPSKGYIRAEAVARLKSRAEDIFLEKTGKTPLQWLKEIYEKWTDDNYNPFNEVRFNMFPSLVDDGTSLRISAEIGLGQLGKIGRHAAVLGCSFRQDEASKETKCNPNIGWVAHIAPMFPWMEWRNTGIWLGQIRAEAGIAIDRHRANSSATVVPYIRPGIDLVGVNLSFISLSLLKLTAGASVFIRTDGLIVPELSISMGIQW